MSVNEKAKSPSPPQGIPPQDPEIIRIKPDVYIAALLDEVNEHLCDLLNENRALALCFNNVYNFLLKSSLASHNSTIYPKNTFKRWFHSPLTTIQLAAPDFINPDVITNITGGAAGYQIEDIYNSLTPNRISPKITVLSVGSADIFTIVSPNKEEWSNEVRIRPGEEYTFWNVMEIRLRSPKAGSLVPIPSGGVYVITEYEHFLRNKIFDQEDAFGVCTSIGLAEQAARTGSPLLFDRRGNFLYLDDFESPTLKFTSAIVGAGTTSRSTDTARKGDQSLKLVTGAVSGNSNTIVYRHMDFHDDTKIGCLFGFSTAELVNLRIQNQIFYFNNINVYNGTLTWRPGSRTLSYINSFGADQVIASNLVSHNDITTWSSLKLVIDLLNKTYVRALFLGREFDLIGIPLGAAPDTAPRRVNSQFSLGTLENAAKTVYIDNYIFTENEP